MAKSKQSAERIEVLVERVRSDIRLGVYEFGQQLRLVDLQEAYSASQFDVRQALLQLKTLNVVEHRQNFGFRVREQESSEPGDLRFVRLALERSAVPLVVARATSSDISGMRVSAEEFESFIEGTRQELTRANVKFHQSIYRASQNAILADLIDDLRTRSYVGTTGRWRSKDGRRASSVEHFEMVSAIERRDPAELDRLILLHIGNF
jgi:DNA-binding GntR family transcriptional regulator